MNSIFLVIAAVMTIGAMQFVIWPAARQKKATSDRKNPAIMVTIGAIPIVAFGVYAGVGNPQAANAGSSAASAVPMQSSAGQSASAKGVASISSLVDGLEERLGKEPEDAQGWLLLAKSYRHLDRRTDFARTYSRARDLGLSEPGLDDYLATIEPTISSTGQASIRGRVSMMDDLRAELSGDTTVFIIARAETGPAAPLAVLRTSVTELPYAFEITDENAMIKSIPLSSVESIVVNAKISVSGDALDTLPDVGASSIPVSMRNSEFIDLTIAR